MVSGMMSVDETVRACIAVHRRRAVMRNHTACHLLQQALREVLGNHVHQAGSMVDNEICRFDFSHFSAMTPKELDRVEYLVNDMILSALDVNVSTMSLDEAKEMGAMALFGEKYGDVVRVCNAGGRSIELCGGTHVDNTSKIGLFKILKESSVAAGVRRIEAVTGRGVLRLIDDTNAMLSDVATTLKVGSHGEIPAKVSTVVSELKAKDKEIERLNQKIADLQVDGLFDNAQEVGPVQVIYAVFTGTKPDALRAMADKIKSNAPRMVAILGTIQDGKATLAAACGPEAVANGVHAGKLMKEVTALVGGSGGGKPDTAMGGASEIFKLDEAFVQIPSIIEKMIQKK